MTPKQEIEEVIERIVGESTSGSDREELLNNLFSKEMLPVIKGYLEEVARRPTPEQQRNYDAYAKMSPEEQRLVVHESLKCYMDSMADVGYGFLIGDESGHAEYKAKRGKELDDLLDPIYQKYFD